MGRTDGGAVTACVRRAWLTLGPSSIELDDPSSGYGCESLDLGYPAPREVVDLRPDADGATDRTQFMGQRVVTADIHAVEGAWKMDAVAAAFAPYMVPSARPVLHYILDRPGLAERTLGLRPSNYTWPIAGPAERQIQLQFVAADPVVRDPTLHSATAWAGGTGTGGRAYDLTFNRQYPAGAGPPVTATITSSGDLVVRPVLAVYGPITAGAVTFRQVSDGAVVGVVAFVAGYQITGGNYVLVDTAAHNAYLNGDPTRSVLSAIDWTRTTWPALPVLPDSSNMTIAGSSSGLVTSGVTQVQATWQDGYLS